MTTLLLERTALSLKEHFPLAYYEDGCLWDAEGDCVASGLDQLIENNFDGTTIPIPHSSGNPEKEGVHVFWNGSDYIKQELGGDYAEAYDQI